MSEPEEKNLMANIFPDKKCPYCNDTKQIVIDHPIYGPEVTECPDCCHGESYGDKE